jgi:hypothetical protein
MAAREKSGQGSMLRRNSRENCFDTMKQIILTQRHKDTKKNFSYPP